MIDDSWGLNLCIRKATLNIKGAVCVLWNYRCKEDVVEGWLSVLLELWHFCGNEAVVCSPVCSSWSQFRNGVWMGLKQGSQRSLQRTGAPSAPSLGSLSHPVPWGSRSAGRAAGSTSGTPRGRNQRRSLQLAAVCESVYVCITRGKSYYLSKT